MGNLKCTAFLAIILVGFLACDDKNEDVTQSVNKSGSVETVVHIGQVDSARDELITTHKVWLKNAVYKTVEYRDTIPALGYETRVAENNQGDTKNVSVKKDYEIYITVK